MVKLTKLKSMSADAENIHFTMTSSVLSSAVRTNVDLFHGVVHSDTWVRDSLYKWIEVAHHHSLKKMCKNATNESSERILQVVSRRTIDLETIKLHQLDHKCYDDCVE